MLKLIILITSLFLTSCATKVHGLRKTADFNYQNIRRNHITIGGVIHAGETWKHNKKISLANQFRIDAQESRRDISFDSASYLVKRIGKGVYREVLREIAEDASLSDNSLSILSQSLNDRRYIAFARIESDIVENSLDNSDVTDSNGKATGEKKLTTYTERHMDINFFVYDIKNKYLSWNGIVKKSKLDSHTYFIREKSSLENFFVLLSGSNNKSLTEKYPFPKKPNEKYILSKAFEGFAQNLPEKN